MEENYSLTFNEYMENPRKYGKYAIVITKSQYAIEVNEYTHEGMVADLKRKTRPDIKIDCWGNSLDKSKDYMDGNIVIVGYPNYMLVELPKKEYLSDEQFECFKNILYAIKEYNKITKQEYGESSFDLIVYGTGNIKIKYDNYKDRIDELIDLLSGYVSSDVNVPEEEIIGAPISQKHFGSM